MPFLLGGSALLDALGLDVEVRDVDLMLRPEDRDAVRGGLRATGSSRVTTEPGAVLTSAWKATLDVDGVEVEGLGGLGVRGRRRRRRSAPAGSRRYGAADVPLCDPAVWLELYRAYKPEKAAAARASTAAGYGVGEG